MREALGRSRGGYGTKVCVIADGAGRALEFALAPGQAHELPLAPDLLEVMPEVPSWIVVDRGYASDAFRQRIWDCGARPAIPPKSTDTLVAYLQQPQPRRAPLGQAQGVAGHRNSL